MTETIIGWWSIDYVESEKNHLIKVDETKAYSLQQIPSFISDLSIIYRINKKNVSHEFSVQLLNLNEMCIRDSFGT